MQTLRIGSRGDFVESLQTFLNNFIEPDILTDGDFGNKTRIAVIKVQKDALSKGLNIGSKIPDGTVGPKTAGAFMQMGWEPYEPSDKGSDSNFTKPSWKGLTTIQKIKKFGNPGNPPAKPKPGGPIKVNSLFRKEIVEINMKDYLDLKSNFIGPTKLYLNKKVEKQWIALLKDINNNKFDKDLLSCAGSWVPRYVRGSTSTFSSHAYGTAVDFNAPENYMGCTPAKKWEKGYLGNIINLAKKYYIFNGVWFKRTDAMHFSSSKTDDELKRIGII